MKHNHILTGVACCDIVIVLKNMKQKIRRLLSAPGDYLHHQIALALYQEAKAVWETAKACHFLSFLLIIISMSLQ